MNILHIKLYVRTDIKGSTEEPLFHNNQKDGKLFRITSSLQNKASFSVHYCWHASPENRTADLSAPQAGTMVPYTTSGVLLQFCVQ